MKRLFFDVIASMFCFALLLAGVALSIPAIGEEALAQGATWVVSGEAAVCLYRAPSTSASLLAELAPGETVEATGREMGAFVEIVWQGQTGYLLKVELSASEPGAAGDEVTEEEDTTHLSEETYMPTTGADDGDISGPVATQSQEDVDGGVRISVLEDCNVRSLPGLPHTPLGIAHGGDTMDATGRTEADELGVTWHEVVFDGGLGWISSRYIATATADDAAPGDMLWEAETARGVRAASGDTNVRSGPGLDYSVLGVLKKETSLPFTGDVQYDDRDVAWYSVEWEGVQAWVSSRYVQLG